MQKQETHGTQSMGFEDAQQFLLSTQTKKAPGLIAQTGGSIIFNTTYLRLFLISSSTVEI
jgi:hypothetical protein